MYRPFTGGSAAEEKLKALKPLLARRARRDSRWAALDGSSYGIWYLIENQNGAIIQL